MANMHKKSSAYSCAKLPSDFLNMQPTYFVLTTVYYCMQSTVAGILPHPHFAI